MFGNTGVSSQVSFFEPRSKVQRRRVVTAFCGIHGEPSDCGKNGNGLPSETGASTVTLLPFVTAFRMWTAARSGPLNQRMSFSVAIARQDADVRRQLESHAQCTLPASNRSGLVVKPEVLKTMCFWVSQCHASC